MRRIIDERRRQRRFFSAHQAAARRALDARDCLRLPFQKLFVVPDAGASQHQVAVVVCETFGDPESSRIEWPREIPWSKFFRTESLDVPDVKELVGDSTERFFVNAGLAERARFDDLRRSQVFHSIA